MNAPRTGDTPATLAAWDAVHAQDESTHVFNLMRMLASDMERDGKAGLADSGMLAAWAGMLSWLVTTVDDRNDELRERYVAAGWVQESGQTGTGA